MMRRFALAAFLVTAVLSFAPAALATPPGQTTFGITELFDESSGVFTSDGSIVCASGTTSNDTFATGFPSGRGGLFHVRKTITCNDGSGTFVLQIQAQTGFRADGTLGPWVVLSGTGAYEDLRGTGNVVGTFIPGGISDVYTGWLSKP